MTLVSVVLVLSLSDKRGSLLAAGPSPAVVALTSEDSKNKAILDNYSVENGRNKRKHGERGETEITHHHHHYPLHLPAVARLFLEPAATNVDSPLKKDELVGAGGGISNDRRRELRVVCIFNLHFD